MEFIFSLVRSVILFGLLVFVAFRIFRILRPFEKGLIERFGKYNREATSGLNIVIPGIERLIVVDMREQVIDCLLYTSPSPRDRQKSRMPSSA